MKKGMRLIKRVVALFLVLLLSIESFGAVVSDNDGSAFITKAEFDSLKNDFQSQIDQYNTSIDAKIDGAIASYLAGITVSKDTQYRVDIADWKEVVATNFPLYETWQPADFNLSFSFSYCSTDNDGDYYETWWGLAGISYKRPATEYQVRNLVDAGVERTDGTFPETVVWCGQSQDLVDKISGVKSGVCDSEWGDTQAAPQRHYYRYLAGSTNTGTSMNIINCLYLSPGYFKDKILSDVWHAQMYWRWNSAGWPLEPKTSTGWINQEITTSITLNTVDDKQYKNEHIISWDNVAWSGLTDVDWTGTFGENEFFTEDGVLSDASTTKSGQWAVFELGNTAMPGEPSNWETTASVWNQSNIETRTIRYQPQTRSFQNFYSGGYGATRTNKLVSVGVLDTTYTSEKIYQWSGKLNLVRNDNVSIEKMNLYNGALIGYAKAEEIFKWTPKITGTYNNGTTDVEIKKWRVKLSKNKFGVKDTVSAVTDVLKNKDQTEDYLVTDEPTGTCKFNIEIDEDTTIFCKWWPDDTNICNNYDWKGTLDLTQCGTYMITAS